MTDIFDWARLSEWIEGPCISCGDSAERNSEHTAVSVTRPRYVDPYLESIAGPGEQHEAGDGHCINPKCRYTFSDLDKAEIQRTNGEFTCPKCGYTYDYFGAEKNPVYPKDDDQAFELGLTKDRPANPGGMTRSGLTLDEMGHIGEQVIARVGDLPNVGAVIFVSDDKHGPIDAIVEGKKGKFGCEIKANHSQAQERFKVGGQRERQAKITYCLTNGLKPALIGVRLNFYTDKAFIFFREGLTDTWIGNSKMQHIATVDFADLNPFKSPDTQAQALAVDNANLPDQSEEDEFAQAFGSIKQSDDEQPRDDKGKFTFKKDVHELKIVDKKGKHHHTVKRCQHCGALYHKEPDEKGRATCPTCGEDPERKLTSAKVVLAGNDADEHAKQLGFSYLGRSGAGHRQYTATTEDGVTHMVQVGSGAHGKRGSEIDADRARQRMQQCLNGACRHTPYAPEAQQQIEGGGPVFRVGETVQTGDGVGIVLGIDGDLVYVKDYQSGQAKQVPGESIQAVAASDPSYLYVYYMGELHVEPYDVNVSYERILGDLMSEFGVDLTNAGMDIDPTDVDAGEIRPRGFSIDIKHKQLCEPEVRWYAERAIHDWWQKQNNEPWGDKSPWQALDNEDYVLAPSAA